MVPTIDMPAHLLGRAEHEIRAQVEGDDREMSFGYLERVMLGDCAIVHGGVYKELEASPCPDSSIDRATVGAWRVR